MHLSTSHFIPMKLSSRSWSSTGSWDSNISGSFTEDSEQVLAWGSRCGETGESGWSSLHGLNWGFDNDKEKIEGKWLDDIFWQDGVNQSTELEAAADKPDLLDRLIMEDQEEKIIKFKAMSQHRSVSLQLPSLENLLRLLEIQQMSSNPPEGRPITGCQVTLSPSTTTYLDMMNAQLAQVTHIFPNKFPPIHYKVPPPHHPPAVPASFHLPPSTQNCPIRASFQAPSSLSSSPSFPTPGSAAAVQLRVDEAKWQYQAIEKERKKTEAALALQNPGKKISSSNSVQIPRLPLGPTRLDKLVVDCLREQARVVTLLDRADKSRGCSLSSLYSSLSMWKESVLVVMAIRRRERMGQEAREIGEELDEALARMSLATRKAR